MEQNLKSEIPPTQNNYKMTANEYNKDGGISDSFKSGQAEGIA